MQMIAKRNNAFILVLLIAVMAVLAVLIFVLSSVSNRIAFEANDVYLRACSDNLIASGLAWAEYNKKELLSKDTMILDVNSMAVKNSQLAVTCQAGRGISLKISCSKSGLNFSDEVTLQY